MNYIFLSILFSMFSTFSMAHDYFFAFAEMEYNEVSQRIEATVMVTTHDLEKMFEINEGKIIRLDAEHKDSLTTILSNDYIQKHFQVITKSNTCKFELVGYETALNGTTNFYFESEQVDLTSEFLILFDVLMDQYPQQQNKITLLYRDKSYTYVFLSNQRIATIKLN